MAEKPIDHSSIIEPKVFQPAADSADILIEKINLLISGIKELAKLTGKKLPIADPKTLSDAEKLQEALKKITDLENGLTEAQKLQLKAQQLLSEQKKQYRNELKAEVSAYQQLQNQFKAAEQKAKDLAAQVALGNNSLAGAAKKASEDANALNQKLKDIDAGMGNFGRNVGDYKNQLRELEKVLQNLQPGTKEFQDAATKAGELRDKISDAKDATKAFSKESKAGVAKSLFGQIAQDIKDLDFKGAADKGKQFKDVIKGMSFDEVVSGIKNFGSALLDLGKTILLNPFVLIAAAVIGLIKVLSDLPDVMNEGNKSFEDAKKSVDDLTESYRGLREEVNKLKIDDKVAAGELKKSDGERIKLAQETASELEKLEKTHKEKLQKINEDFEKEREDDGFKGTKNLLDAVGIETDATKKKAEAIKLLEEETAKIKLDIKTKALLQAKQVNRDEIAEEQKTVEERQKEWAKWDKWLADTLKEIEDKKKKAQEEEKARLKKLQDEADAANQKLNEAAQERAKQDAELFRQGLKVLDEQGKSELELKIKKLEEERDEILKSTLFTEKQRLEINQAYAQKIRELKNTERLKQKELDDKARKEKEEEAKKEREEAKKAAQERLEREITVTQKIADTILKGIEERDKRELKMNQDKISELDKQIEFQQQLALQGEKNTLAELQKERAKALEEKRRIEQRDARVKEAEQLAELFLEFLKVYAKDGFAAAGKATVATIAAKAGAKLIAGAFAEGVENFKGKGTETSDSNLIAFSKGESVLTARGTKETPGLATSINEKGFLGVQEWAMKNIFPRIPVLQDKSMSDQVNERLISMLHSEVQGLRKDIQTIPNTDFEENVLGEIVMLRRRTGITEKVTFKNVNTSYSKH